MNDQIKPIDPVSVDDGQRSFLLRGLFPPTGGDAEATVVRDITATVSMAAPSQPAAGNTVPDISGVNGVWLAAPCCAAAVTVHSCEDREDSQKHGRAANFKMSPAIFGTVLLYNQMLLSVLMLF